MCEIGLLYPKTVKEMKKKEELGDKNPVLEQEEMDSLHFFKWLLLPEM